MTREAVSAAKPAVRAQAKTERCTAPRLRLRSRVWCTRGCADLAVLLFLIGYHFGDGHSASQAVAVPVELYL